MCQDITAHRRLIFTSCLIPLLAGSMVQGAPPARLDPDRIKAVAGMLPAAPEGLGYPVSHRDAWEKLASRESFRSVVSEAEKLLRESLPETPDDLYLDFSRTGNRSRWQAVNRARRSRLSLLTLAECIENKGRFLPALEETVRALCKEKTWVMPAHDRSLANFEGKQVDIDLASSAVGWNMATADYLLADKLSPETRRLIRDNVDRRILTPFRDMVQGKRKPNWWMLTTNNWNAVCLAGTVGSALAMAEDPSDRALFIVAAEAYSKNFLRGFSADGYCSEGLGYWNYGFGHYLLLAETIHQATGGRVDLLQVEGVAAPATFAVRIEIINDICPAFADCSLTAKPYPLYMYYVSRRLNLGLREWERIDPIETNGGLVHTLIFSFPNSASQAKTAAKAFAGPGPRTWFEQAGVLICRPGERKSCRLGVALKGGHNAEHHNHNDVGSYVAVVGKHTLLVDPGSERYTARTFSSRRYESKVLNSYGHPVPVVGGKLQKTGHKARGRIVRTEFTDAADILVLDISSAYDVPGLKKLQRTFTYSREGAGSLTVTDAFVCENPQSFGTVLITFAKWEKRSDGTLVIRDGGESLRVDIRVEGADFEITAEQLEEDVRAPTRPTRIGINLSRPVTQASVTIVATPE